MGYSEFHSLERQAAFWRNSVYDFEQTIKTFKNRLPEKWVKIEDVEVINNVLITLKAGLKLCLQRQRDIIDTQLECLDDFIAPKFEEDNNNVISES